MTQVHKPFDDDGVTYCGWDGHEGCGEVWPCSTVRGITPLRMTDPHSLLLTPDDFSYVMRWEFVRAYPMLSGVPDAREATRPELEQGFERVLLSEALQVTLRSATGTNRQERIL